MPSSAPAEDGQRDVDAILEASARSARGLRTDEPTEAEQADALEWFLSDSDDTDLRHTFQINVGSIDHPKWIDWTVQPVDMDRLRKIRRQASAQGRRRAGGAPQEMDEIAANVAVVLEGTVKPNLRSASRELGVVDPGVAVRSRFSHKPGLLAQIAGQIMSLSGYDDDDIREVDAARG